MNWLRETVYSTPWFSLVARKRSDAGDAAPFYSLVLPDYTCVVARTIDRKILLVRQVRPAVEGWTLELPAGMVDAGEAPEQTMRRELEEETGHTAGGIIHLGTLVPDTGRLSNRLWCYWADDVRPIDGPFTPEVEVESPAVSEAELHELLRTSQFNHALHVAALSLAMMQGYLATPNPYRA